MLVCLVLPFKTLAKSVAEVLTNPDIGTPVLPGSSVSDLFGLSSGIINLLLGIIGAILVIVIAYGGVQYLTAGPETEKAELGRKTLEYAIVGLIIILASLAIVTFIHTNLG